MILPQAPYIPIDVASLSAVREILGDTDPNSPVFTDFRLGNAMRDNRRTVLFRDPAYTATGVVPYVLFSGYRGRVPLNLTNVEESLLQPEPDRASYQALPYFRHWDNQSAIIVWRNGVTQHPDDLVFPAQSYSVSYVEGRITFTDSVTNDWESINASCSYYPIYRIARQVLSAHYAQMLQGATSVKLSNDAWSYPSVKERLAMINAVLADFVPKTIRRNKRMY